MLCLGLMLTSIVFYSSIGYSLIAYRKYFNTSCHVNGEERAVSQRTWGPNGKGFEQAPLYMYIFRSISRLASRQMKLRRPKLP